MTDTTDNRALVERLLGFHLRKGYAVQTGAGTYAPSVVWADADYEVGDGSCGLHETQKPANEPSIPYVRIDALTAALDRIEALEAEIGRLKNPPERYCAICCHPESNHPYRHQFVERIISKGEPT